MLPRRYLGTFFGRAILWVTESRFFEAENLLFFIYAVRVSVDTRELAPRVPDTWVR